MNLKFRVLLKLVITEQIGKNYFREPLKIHSFPEDGFIVQKMVKTLHFQCSDFQFLKMFG